MVKQKPQAWFFYLCALEGVIAIYALLIIPSEGVRISAYRADLIAILLAFVLLWMFLAIRYPHILTRFESPAFIILSALLALTFSLLLFLLRYFDPERFLSAYIRLRPLFLYMTALSAQTAIFLLLSYKGFHSKNLLSKKPVYFSAFIAFCALLFVFVLIWITRLGLTPDTAYWGEPGVPLLGWQFGLALIAGMSIFMLSFYIGKPAPDKILPLLIYVFAVTLWLLVPASVLTRSFYMPMTRPTF